ncbi:MAG: WYL domain-containing protein [Acidimicrobiia bacterium]|nr:WYL domain-containing protein [Acidimicrobiia bacterium]
MSGKTGARLVRILAMLPWAIAHDGVGVEDLCARFGYTRKELVDDLQIVFLCGLPGYGPGDLIDADIYDDEVVVRTADYFAGAPRLSPAEALALLASGLALIASGQAGPELESAVEKLTRSLLPEEESRILDVDLAGEPELVGRFRRAAANGSVLEMIYTSLARDETTTREIEPLTVFSSMGNWYVQAHCRLAGDRRLFRIDRIRQLTETGEVFDPPKERPVPEVRYTPSADDIRCRLELDAPARWVAEYYPVEVVHDDGQRLVVDFSVGDPSVAARLLLRLGPHARLIEGPELRASLEKLRTRLLELYAD